MPEQNGFEQLRWERAAIDRNKHLIGTGRVRMNGFSNEFFTRAGFARDEDSGPTGCDLRHLVKQTQHAFAFANDIGKGIALL